MNILLSFNTLHVKLVENYFFGCRMKVEIMDGDHLPKILNCFKRQLVSRLQGTHNFNQQSLGSNGVIFKCSTIVGFTSS